MPPKRKSNRVAEVQEKKSKQDVASKEGLEWNTVGEADKAPYVAPLMVLSSDSMPGRDKVVGFDIDFTLIGTKSGRKFATGATDWEWLYDCVPQKLRDLHNDGYRVVFFTNQAGIEKLKVKPEEIMKKIGAMMDDLNIPVFAFVCTGQNHFRKPSTTVWDYFVDNCNGGVRPDLSKCTYVGDAAGRAKGWAPGKPKDFSCSDRMFAKNIEVDFKTPEEYFLNEAPAPFTWGSFDPVEYMRTHKTTDNNSSYHSKTQELILMVGPPASGKSTFTSRFLKRHGYVHVNRDTLGTAEKCKKAAKEALTSGKSVVVDNTNPSKAARADFLDLVKKSGIQSRCFLMQTPLNIAHHLNLVRQTVTESKVRRIPDVGYNMYKKNFEQPTKAEGFSEVITIDFVPYFESTDNEKVFMQWQAAGH